MNITLSKYLDVSTKYVTENDGRLMLTDAPYRIGEIHGGVGVLFYLPPSDCLNDDHLIREFSIFGFSPAFCNIFLLARSKGARLINFDADGADHDLPTFEW
jgi:hypothetical protein